jgi:hypothetical protein
VAELIKNCRNVHEIAQLVRRHLDDARAPMVGPSALDVERQPADDLRAVIGAVNARLVDRLETDERDPRASWWPPAPPPP